MKAIPFSIADLGYIYDVLRDLIFKLQTEDFEYPDELDEVIDLIEEYLDVVQ